MQACGYRAPSCQSRSVPIIFQDWLPLGSTRLVCFAACKRPNFLQVLSAFSDGLYVSPALFSAGTFARKNKDTYFYHFEHGPRSGPYAAVSSVGTATRGFLTVLSVGEVERRDVRGYSGLEPSLGLKQILKRRRIEIKNQQRYLLLPLRLRP